MFQISRTVRRTETEDGGVLLDVHHGKIFCLNVVGSKILDLLEKGFGTAEIVRELSAAYAMDIETVGADVREFIKALQELGVLEASRLD